MWVGAGVSAYLLGACGSSLILLGALCALLLNDKARRRTSKLRRHRGWLVRNAHRHGFLKTIGFEVPRWLGFSSIESSTTLRRAVSQLWPYAKDGLDVVIKSNLDWAINHMGLSNISLRQFKLGSTAPVILGIDTVETTTGISLDISFQLSGDSDVIVDAKEGRIKVSAELTDLVVSGVLRLTCAALTTDLIPGFKAISVSFVRKPKVSFNLKALEIPLTSIPGLPNLISHAVQDLLASAIVWPKTVWVPLYNEGLSDDETAMMRDHSGVGVLRVVVYNADNLKRPTMLRVADPYVCCTCNGSDMKKTATKEATSNPTWNESFEFIIYDWSTSTIEFDVQDVGRLTQIVKSLGKASVDVASLNAMTKQKLQLPLDTNQPGLYMPVSGQGHIQVEVSYHPFLEFGKNFVSPSQPIASAAWSCAFLNIEVVSCDGLLLTPGESAKIRVKCKRESHTTTAIKHDGSIGQKFLFTLKSLNVPVTLALERSNHFGDRQIMLVKNGQLQFGSRPTYKSVLLNSLHTTSVTVVLCISVQIVQEVSEPITDSAKDPSHDELEVPKQDIISHVSHLVASQQPTELSDNAMLVALVTVPYILGLYMANFIFGFIVAATIGVLHYSTILKQEREQHAKEISNAYGPKPGVDDWIPDLTLTKDEKVELLSMLPLWMSKPDMEKSSWLNYFTELLWPYLRSNIQRILCASINQSSNSLFSPSIKVEQCFLGSAPPVITGIKCYDETVHGSNVMFDLGVSFMEDVVIKVRIKIGPCEFTVVLDNVFIETVLRLELGPPIPAVPPFKGIEVAVLGDVNLDFSLMVAGFPVTSIPGVAYAMQNLVKSVLKSHLMVPNSLPIPIWSNERWTETKHGSGLLRIHIRRASSLHNVNLLKALEPRCVAKFCDDSDVANNNTNVIETSTASRTEDPEWDERFEILVRSDAAAIKFEIQDYDMVGPTSVIGMTKEIVITRDLIANKLTHCNFALATANARQGTLHADLTWKPFTTEISSTKRERGATAPVRERNLAGDYKSWAAGVLFVEVLSCQNIGQFVEVASNTCFVSVDVGGDAKRTSKAKGPSPSWSTAKFHFPVTYIAQQKVHVQLMNRNRQAMGSLIINISDVVNSGGSLAGTWDLSNSQGASVKLDMVFRGVCKSDQGQETRWFSSPTSHRDKGGGVPGTPSPCPSEISTISHVPSTPRQPEFQPDGDLAWGVWQVFKDVYHYRNR